MKPEKVIQIFNALGHESRLEIFKALIHSGRHGLRVNELADLIGLKQNTLSTNLQILLHAQLVKRSRQGRYICYQAEMGTLKDLFAYVLEDCCGGDAQQCRSLFNQLDFAC